MKKIAKSLFSVFVSIMMIACLGVFADDGDTGGAPPPSSDSKFILSLNVDVSGNSLLVSGETDEGILAVAIAVYDKSGSNLVTMQTAAVNSENVYESSLELEDGDYVIKVADYDGGNYLTKSVTVGNPDSEPSKDEDKEEDKKEEKDKKEENDKKDKPDKKGTESKTEEKTEDKDIKNVEENTSDYVDEYKKTDNKVYFPKTSDCGSCLLMISSLGAIASFPMLLSLKKKKKVNK